MSSQNRIDGRPVPPPVSNDDDDRPYLPPLRTFIVHRSSILVDPRVPDVMLTAHGYDTDAGIARFFIFCVETRNPQEGPVILQYICRSFKEWIDIEEVYQVSAQAH